MDDLSECWDYEKLSALSMNNKFIKPAAREKRCSWLVLRTGGENHFDQNKSTINLSGPSDYAMGVIPDTGRKAFKSPGFLLVPICIEMNATDGLWTVEIVTEAAQEGNPFREIISGSFQIGLSFEISSTEQ